MVTGEMTDGRYLILSRLLSVLPVYGDLAQHGQAVLGRDLDVLSVQAE